MLINLYAWAFTEISYKKVIDILRKFEKNDFLASVERQLFYIAKFAIGSNFATCNIVNFAIETAVMPYW